MDNTTDDDPKKPDVYSYAVAFNYLLAMSALSYGDISDFISDNLKKCLDNGIVSAHAATDPIWMEKEITVEDCSNQEPCMEYNNPFTGLRYNDDPQTQTAKRYWPYPVKKVNLPVGWKLLKGCGCNSNMVLDAFSLVDNNNNIIKTLSFFEADDYNKPKKRDVIEMIDSVFDEMENNVQLDETST
ncbi:MAG: hypothetical protein MUO21_01090 [Nitrososphaeraceae archaeon]|nr:hypothetical protein [Nitrososphaeraceae archaeon]